MFDTLLIPSTVPCPLGVIIDGLDDTSRKNLAAALNNSEVSTASIVRAIRVEANRAIDKSTVGKHRRGECRCV